MLQYKTDVTEDPCLRFTPSSHTHKGPAGEGVCSGMLSSSPVHSHPEDGLTSDRSVLVISDTVRISIHPQEKASNSFGAFLDPINKV